MCKLFEHLAVKVPHLRTPTPPPPKTLQNEKLGYLGGCVLARTLTHLFKNLLFFYLSRCWRVLKSWTTACCWVSTSWTRGTEGIRTSRREGTERDLWPSECSTPLPWSPFRGTAKLLRPSPPTTREWAQLVGEVGGGDALKLCTHIWACTHSASVCLLVPYLFFTLRGTVTQQRSQSARGLSHSHIHSYTQHKHTLCVFTVKDSNVNARKYPLQQIFVKLCQSSVVIWIACQAPKKKKRKAEEKRSYSLTSCVSFTAFSGWVASRPKHTRKKSCLSTWVS